LVDDLKNISKTSESITASQKLFDLEADEDEGDKCVGENPACQYSFVTVLQRGHDPCTYSHLKRSGMTTRVVEIR
jgi:hypothetical protein